MPRPPKSFYGFIGQQKITDSIKRLAKGCQSTGQPLPHMLLVGASGSGKTHLAEAIAAAMGTKTHYILAGKETDRNAIASTLARLSFGDICFIDEIHALPHLAQELLYPAIDNRRTLATDANGRRKQEWVDLEPYTLIAATDRPGELRNALRRRISQTYTMDDYAEDELREIAAVRATTAEVLLTPQTRTILAKVCRGSPRILKHMIAGIKIYFPECAREPLRKKHIVEYLKGEGIDALGLKQRDHAYLSVLRDRDNRPTSLQSLSLAMGCDSDYVAHEIEPFLVKVGLVSLDKTGRLLTPRGLAYRAEGV